MTLDDRVLHDGSFLSGFEATLELEPGPHRLTTRIEVGPFSRSRSYDFVLEADAGYREGPRRYLARLVYSRFWGNFTKKLDVSADA